MVQWLPRADRGGKHLAAVGAPDLAPSEFIRELTRATAEGTRDEHEEPRERLSVGGGVSAEFLR